MATITCSVAWPLRATSNLPYAQRLNILCIGINWQEAEEYVTGIHTIADVLHRRDVSCTNQLDKICAFSP